jgi:hypothetical protein
MKVIKSDKRVCWNKRVRWLCELELHQKIWDTRKSKKIPPDLVLMANIALSHTYHAMADIKEVPDSIVVSIIRDTSGSSDSYVEVLISKEDTKLYDYFFEKIAILQIAGPEQVVKGIGETYSKELLELGTFYIDITPEVHSEILHGVDAATNSN